MKSETSTVKEQVARNKKSLRRTMRRRRGELTLESMRAWAYQAARHLMQLVEREAVSTVGLYAARGGELGTLELARLLRDRGLALAYPRVVLGQRLLVFHRVTDPSSLEPGSLGIAEPRPEAAIVASSAIELFVVPGLAFDRRGGRLGSGKGYYDRTLAASDAIRVGYCYECQVVNRVPSATHDMDMHFLVTEAGIIQTGSRATDPLIEPLEGNQPIK